MPSKTKPRPAAKTILAPGSALDDRKKFREMELLLRIAKDVAGIDSLDELLTAVVEISAKETGGERGTLFLNDAQTGELYSRRPGSPLSRDQDPEQSGHRRPRLHHRPGRHRRGRLRRPALRPRHRRRDRLRHPKNRLCADPHSQRRDHRRPPGAEQKARHVYPGRLASARGHGS